MRASILLPSVIAALAAASSADAQIPYLQAAAGAGACGGDIHCFITQTSIPPDPTNSTTAMASEGNTLADGSYANAHTTAVFGHLHAYADAYRASGSDAQAKAQGYSHEEFDAGSFVPGLKTTTFTITGSFSPHRNVFGNFAFGSFDWQIYDSVTNQRLDYGVWESTDAMPQTTIPRSFTIPAGHGYELDESFEADAYSSFGIVDIANYSDTIDTYVATPGGGHVISESGHDYAAPFAVGGVPEPVSWGLMAMGFGIIGGFARIRRDMREIALTIS